MAVAVGFVAPKLIFEFVWYLFELFGLSRFPIPASTLSGPY
jgi:hypothetical protein